MDRMPIACAHCAKAKAKCDKKVPCTRCVGKQIICQSRATRRSSQHPGRRANISKGLAERHIRASTAFQIPKPAQGPRHKRGLISQNSAYARSRPFDEHSTVQMVPAAVPMTIAPASSGTETHGNLHQTTVGSTTPDLCLPVTPKISNIPPTDIFWPFDSITCDPNIALQYNNVSNVEDTWENGLLDFDPGIALFDFYPGADIWPAQSDPAFREDFELVYPQLNQGCMSYPFEFQKGSCQELDTCINPEAIKEAEAVLVAQQFWPFFRCNRIGNGITRSPKTAHIYLESLFLILQNRTAGPTWSLSNSSQSNLGLTKWSIATIPLDDWSREKLLAITQGVLHKALDVHGTIRSPGLDQFRSSGSKHMYYLMLPPPSIVQLSLQNFIVRYEPFYPTIAGGELDPNVMIQGPNSKAAALLILLMIAAGAAAIPAQEARALVSGLTEACRVSLFDYIEKDVLQAKDTLVLRSALLFTCLAAWSGDKWHMDMAMGQRGLYLAMLSHSGLLEPSNSYLEMANCKLDPEKAWDDWKEYEGQHRLGHSWAVLDQEISLFSDTVPLLSVVDLHMPVPDLDHLWHAKSASDWLILFEQAHGAAYQSPVSVREMFSKFAEGDLAIEEHSPIRMRLLLHPLHAHVSQLRQFMTCLPDSAGKKSKRSPSKNSARSVFGDLNALLEKWYDITRMTCSGAYGQCWGTLTNLIMFHLISLNTVASFKCIEQFARRDVDVDASMVTSWLQMRGVENPTKVNFHCGQILRILKTMPESVRPPWWAGAVYRVALMLWASSMLINTTQTQDDLAHVAIDSLTAEDERLQKYLKHQHGVPVLISSDTKSILAFTPSNVLLYCTKMLSQEPNMRLSEGIWRNLNRLMNEWA